MFGNFIKNNKTLSIMIVLILIVIIFVIVNNVINQNSIAHNVKVTVNAKNDLKKVVEINKENAFIEKKQEEIKVIEEEVVDEVKRRVDEINNKAEELVKESMETVITIEQEEDTSQYIKADKVSKERIKLLWRLHDERFKDR